MFIENYYYKNINLDVLKSAKNTRSRRPSEQEYKSCYFSNIQVPVIKSDS